MEKQLCKSAFSYVELKEFMDIFRKAITKACRKQDFEPLKKYFTDNAEYTFCPGGVDRNFTGKEWQAFGPESIVKAISEREMYRFKGWTLNMTDYIIDPRRGDIIMISKLSTPYTIHGNIHSCCHSFHNVFSCYFKFLPMCN